MSAVIDATELEGTDLETQRVPLRDLLSESQNGLSKRRADEGEPVPVLRLADVVGGVIDESDPRAINLTKREIEKYALQRGDLLCIRVNGSRSLVGRVVPFVSHRVWAYCDHFIRLRPRQDLIDPRYLTHYLNTREARRYVELNMVSSAGQNTVSQGTMLELTVPLPGLAKQCEIVAEIDKQFSRLDEAVANLKRVKANLQRYKAAVLKAAVEGRLVPTEAEVARREGRNFETGAQLLERILETRESQRIGRGKYKGACTSETTDSSVIPESWVWTSLGLCFHVAVGATPSRKEPSYWGGDIPWVSSGEVQFGRIRRTEEQISALGLSKTSTQVNPPGSVLLGMIGQGRTRGQAAILDIHAANNQNCAAIWVSDTAVPSEYVFYWLMSRYDDTRRRGSGNNQQALNKTLVEQIPLPLPPLAEQRRIVAEVDRRLSLVRETEAEVDANLKRAQALRQAALGRAFGDRLVSQ